MISESTHLTKEGLDQVLLSLVKQVEDIPQELPVPDTLRQEIFAHLGYGSVLEVIILISGIQPGTGSSTLKRLLCRVMGYPDNPDAGFYRRALAHYWAETLKESTQPPSDSPTNENSTRTQWESFENFIRNSTGLFVEYMRASINPKTLLDDELIPFNIAQAKYSSDSDFWERLPDNIVRDQITEPGVWQGKFTAVVDWIIDEDFSNADLAYPLIRVLLTIDPDVAAARVAPRENWTVEKALDQNEIRKNRDEDVLKDVYGKDFSIFENPQLFQMDTTHLSPSEEVTLLLSRIAKRTRD